jgi:hypothetical protein
MVSIPPSITNEFFAFTATLRSPSPLFNAYDMIPETGITIPTRLEGLTEDSIKGRDHCWSGGLHSCPYVINAIYSIRTAKYRLWVSMTGTDDEYVGIRGWKRYLS